VIALFLLALQFTSPSTGAPLKSRVDLLTTWIQAADGHVPNTIDEPLQVVRALSREDIATVMEDLRSLVILLREPNTRTFDVQEGSSRTSHRIPYTSRDLEMLRDLARPIRESGDVDRPLERGAVLHGDIARLAPPEGEPYDDSAPVGPFAQTALLTDDGRRTRRVKMVSHWSAAMAMLDEVRPKSALRRTPRAPAESPFVKRWYRAILAWQVREQEFVAPLFRRAGDLFPDDPDIQFLIGCRHETEATPGVQAALGSNRLFAPSTGIGSMRAELEDAEKAFRKVLVARTDDVHARIRHGRVLQLLGRHADAVAALRGAAAAPKAFPLDYVAALFLGRALEASGDTAGAHEAYRQAASLARSAPAPLLALSALAERAGDHDAAVTLLRQAMEKPGESESGGRNPGSAAPDDPLWTYMEWGGRDADALLAELAAG
jgi:tetratricopeptide (TPR) repeat protein